MNDEAADREFGRPLDKADRVFITQSRKVARGYARRHPLGDLARGGDVYVVEPLSELEPAPASVQLSANAACVEAARVVAVRPKGIRRHWLDQLPDDGFLAWVDGANAIRPGFGVAGLLSA